MFSRIGVATDLSPASEAAVEMAAQLAKQFQIPLFVLHVYDLPVLPMMDAAVMLPTEYLTDAIRAADERLELLREKLAEKGALQVEVSTSTGGYVDEIISLATQKQIDVLVLGSHGRKGITRLLLGSVAENVLRASPIPVLLVPSKEKEE